MQNILFLTIISLCTLCSCRESEPTTKNKLNITVNDATVDALCDRSFKNPEFPFLLPPSHQKIISSTEKETIKINECDGIKLYVRNDESRIIDSAIIKPWSDAKELIYTNISCNDDHCGGITVTLFINEKRVFGYLQKYEGNVDSLYVPIYNIEIYNKTISFILAQDSWNDEDVNTLNRSFFGKFTGQYSERKIQGTLHYDVGNKNERVILKRVKKNPDPFVKESIN
jgi:hypothetical protein